jgi:hypothetical protein
MSGFFYAMREAFQPSVASSLTMEIEHTVYQDPGWLNQP